MIDALGAQKLTNSQLNLPHGTKRKTMKKQTKKTKKNKKPRCSEETVSNKVRGVSPGPKESPWWERFVKEVGRQPGVKERGSYRW